MDSVESVYEDLTKLIVRLQSLNAEGSAVRSRGLSLAITRLEEAEHWLDRERIPF